MGKSLGYEGPSSKEFVREQQEMERAKRQSAREAKRAEQREHERELQRLADIEQEKKGMHEKHLAELEHNERLKQLDIEQTKELRKSEYAKTVEMADAKLRQEDAEHKHKRELLEAQAKFPVPPTLPPTPASITSVRAPKLPYFDESVDDMDAYLQRFER